MILIRKISDLGPILYLINFLKKVLNVLAYLHNDTQGLTLYCICEERSKLRSHSLMNTLKSDTMFGLFFT